LSVTPPPKCVACGGKEFTAPRDIHGYVPATFGWFGDPLVGFACSNCGYVHLFLKPRKKASDRFVGGKGKGRGKGKSGGGDVEKGAGA
jgi:rubredoxin